MTKLSGKIVEATVATEDRGAHRSGMELRKLRPISGLTRTHVAGRTNAQLDLLFPGEDIVKPQRGIVLSINPEYSEKILEGRKSVELRRRFPMETPPGTSAYIYATSPVKAIVGTAEISDILKLPIEQIWREFEASASIERGKFDKYFEGLSEGYVLILDHVRAFSRPFPLSELREKFGFEPPQSFLYAKRDLRKALRG